MNLIIYSYYDNNKNNNSNNDDNNGNDDKTISKNNVDKRHLTIRAIQWTTMIGR